MNLSTQIGGIRSIDDLNITWSMYMPETSVIATTFLKHLWDEREATSLTAHPLELLTYRSNLLGADLRITNFGGGNTSSKFELPDPISGRPTRVLAVKGSGGDLGSIGSGGFAILYLDKLEQLITRYRGEEHEDEMVEMYSLCAFGTNRVAASIDTPLHAFLPFDHVDHLHPDWAIALAASANGITKLHEFNKRFGRRLMWIPWQRPGFELAMTLRRAVETNPLCEGLVLGSHGLFTWGKTQPECYENSIRSINQLGEFVQDHARRAGRPTFGGTSVNEGIDRDSIAAAILPGLRGAVSSNRRVIAHYENSEDVLTFANSRWAQELSQVGTSCPDHFLRTRICPMFVPWDPVREDVHRLKAIIRERIAKYREDYSAYYRTFARPDSPPLRDTNPSVVVIPALGVFGFSKDKREARISTEFFINAIHVMAGANALDESNGGATGEFPQARKPEQSSQFSSFHNYVALPRSEAFRIEYWTLEEAKLRRMPPGREFSGKIAVIVGGGSGIGREVALQIARNGGHIVVADQNRSAAESVSQEAANLSHREMVVSCALNLSSRESIAAALRVAILQFGGFDVVINTGAIFPIADTPEGISEELWAHTMHVNVSSNFFLASEAGRVLKEQNLQASIVLTSSANAVVPKHGSEAYDISKTAVSHLVRELAIGLGPLVRVNGIAPATVITGSSMFSRERVIVALKKYKVEFSDDESTDSLRTRLAQFYAQRTITHQPILPSDCANAIYWLAGDQSSKTTGHIVPVDGGLPEAFLR
jgi:rhamnose utilization protein RhaD (predicted bifunctional aldolase and dehydrogenase)/NAD(P)-dependent dehydrogenase (short-subunit alcohol dehydrogenase family)